MFIWRINKIYLRTIIVILSNLELRKNISASWILYRRNLQTVGQVIAISCNLSTIKSSIIPVLISPISYGKNFTRTCIIPQYGPNWYLYDVFNSVIMESAKLAFTTWPPPTLMWDSFHWGSDAPYSHTWAAFQTMKLHYKYIWTDAKRSTINADKVQVRIHIKQAMSWETFSRHTSTTHAQSLHVCCVKEWSLVYVCFKMFAHNIAQI